MPRCIPSWTRFLHQFLIDFCSQLRPQKPQNSLKKHWFYRYFCKIGLSKLTSIFDPILVPTWLHFPSQNPPKSLQKPILKGIDFLIDLGIDFYTILAPTWNHLGPQVGAILALKIAQEPPKTLPKSHLGARTRPDTKIVPKCSPRPPQNDTPDAPKWSPRPPKKQAPTFVKTSAVAGTQLAARWM